MEFQEALIRAARDVDAVVIGGGGFWELWPEDFWSGTSLDLEKNFLEVLGKPIFFNALGVDDGRGVGSNAEANFGSLLDVLLSNPKYLVSVRNDGSPMVLRKHFGIAEESVLESPDHGFFASDYIVNNGPPIDHQYVAISLAQDMPNIRFRGGFNTEGLISEIGRAMHLVSERSELSFALVPHIYSDLDVFSNLLKVLPDKIRRERILVSSLQTSSGTGLDGVDAYRHASLAWTMRFHASALAIGAGAPTIGLVSYPKVRSIFSDSGMFEGSGIEISSGDFAQELVIKSRQLLGSVPCQPANRVVSQYRLNLIKQREIVANRIRQWAQINGLN